MRARTKVSLGLLLIVGLALFILAIKLGFLWFLLELFLGALVAMYLYRFLVGLLLLLIRSGTKTPKVVLVFFLAWGIVNFSYWVLWAWYCAEIASAFAQQLHVVLRVGSYAVGLIFSCAPLFYFEEASTRSAGMAPLATTPRDYAVMQVWCALIYLCLCFIPSLRGLLHSTIGLW